MADATTLTTICSYAICAPHFGLGCRIQRHVVRMCLPQINICVEATIDRCLQWLVTLIRYHGDWKENPEQWVAPLVMFVVASEASGLQNVGMIALAHVGFMITKALRQPFQYNSDVWCAIVDCAVVSRGLAHYWAHGVAKTSDARDRLALACAETGCACLGVLYMAAGLWKFNTSHLFPGTGCSTIFYSALVYEYLGALPRVAVQLARVAGWCTALTETAIGVLLLLRPRAGALLGIALHAGIAITPEPNNVVAFGAMMVPRFIFAAPQDVQRVIFCRCRQQGALLVAAMSVLVAIAPACARGPAGFILGGSSLIVARAALSANSDHIETSSGSDRIIHLGCIAATTAYTLLPVLGLMDMGNTHMFANLRVVGGSNHLLVPTGLLQRWRPGGPRGPFAGGVVLVHNTTNVQLRRLYPCELTHRLRDGARDLMRSAGHSAREFIPLEARIYGGEVCGRADDTPQVPYITHAFELRRLLAEAQRRGDVDYEVTYARLPDIVAEVLSTQEDGAWMPDVQLLQFKVDNRGNATCSKLGSTDLDLACPDDAPSQLGWPPVGSPFAVWLITKMLVFNPMPVLPPAENGHVHAEMHCSDG